MYKCNICSKVYDIKPDYCECGNDTFEQTVEPVPSSSAGVFSRNLNEFSVKKFLSVLIFAVCLILSVLVWTIKFPETSKTAETPKKQEKKSDVNIPDIEKIWNSTPPKPEEKAANIITVYDAPVKKDIKNSIMDSIPIQKLNRHNSKTVSSDKNQKTKTPNSPKPVNNNKPKPVTKPKPQTSAKPQAPAKPQPQAPKTVPQTPKPQQVQTQPQKPSMPAQPLEELKVMSRSEWANYKSTLRYTLLSKLDVTKISGEGDCAIEFSFDSNGKLLNRRFIYKSSNKSVNDEVYVMLMKLPVYKVPPAGYKGEKVKMKFYFNNGHYEISFLN